MARPSRLYLRVGTLIVAGGALTVGFVLFLTAGRFRDQGVIFETYLRESVQGLEVGSGVRYRGVAIGRITEIGLAAAEYGQGQATAYTGAYQLVVVRYAVDMTKVGPVPEYAVAMDMGLRTRIASQGLTGLSYLELDFIDSARGQPVPELPWTPRYSFIPSTPSTIVAVTSAAEALVERLGRLDIEGLINGATLLVTDLRTQLGEGDVAQLVREGSATLRTLRETASALQGIAQSPELRATLTSASQAAADLRASLQRLPALIQTLEATARTARNVSGDTQADLSPILRDLRATTANLRETTESLRRSPAQAIFGGPPERR
ncbi:MlaD family protein [Plastoroseomonas arctica]|uniref:MCE family protein n=1 Tax=Plastoroseomonas arctica TaxID=1509237 RepID=A0AAF1KRG5_9PROT|nr:MlaD family protein [Plastoroseomonas arctica]MBR0654252.1 MCE family protein [Plastoroseomonas arctica]